MLYNPAVQPLESDGFTETRVFSIAATGKAFRNLMDGLYSRKIEAVVREICTNAYDSHCAAGYPSRNFRVKLPSIWDPLFSVRDYGTGMPHSQVMDRYSTLFDSTKDKTNDQVGMLGLGSKSPFAYTDGFTLRCYSGQERHTYATYLGEGGVPEISLADVSPSSEPRGVEVSFPVKREDMEAFEEALIRVLKAFPFPPTNLPEEIRKKLIPEIKSQGNGWLLTSKNFLPNFSTVYALQGCVLYPVDLEKLEGTEEAAGALRAMATKLILDFDMGELEFTPGRETLSYTDHTVANLERRWKDFRADLDQHFHEEFSDCQTDWEVAVKGGRAKLDGLFGSLFRLTEYSSRMARVNDSMGSSLLPYSSYELTKIPECDQLTIVGVNPEERARRTRQMNRGVSIPSKAWSYGEVLWVENDPDLRRPWVRLRHYMGEVGSDKAIVFNAGTKRDWATHGNPPLLRLADLPDPPPKPKAPPAPRAPWDRFGVPNARGNWVFVPRDSEMLKGRAFVIVHADHVVEPELGTEAKTWRKLYHYSNLQRTDKLAEAMGVPRPAIIRLRSNEKYGRWAKEPKFQLTTADWVEKLTPREVAWIINTQNYERFKESLYHGVRRGLEKRLKSEETTTWGKHPGKPYAYIHPKTPLDQLSRFEKRCISVPPAFRKNLQVITESLSLQDRDHIITLGLRMGLEVLPECNRETGEFPWPLLPLRWETVARMVTENRPDRLVHASTRQILADYAKGDSQ